MRSKENRVEEGTMYEATKTKVTRIKDKERQLDFFTLAEWKLSCNMPNISLYSVQGMESIFNGIIEQTKPNITTAQET